MVMSRSLVGLVLVGILRRFLFFSLTPARALLCKKPLLASIPVLPSSVVTSKMFHTVSWRGPLLPLLRWMRMVGQEGAEESG